MTASTLTESAWFPFAFLAVVLFVSLMAGWFGRWIGGRMDPGNDSVEDALGDALGADIVEPVEDAVARGAIPHDPRGR